MWRKGNPCALLVGMEIGAAILANSTKFPQKIKNRGTCLAQSVEHMSLDFGSGHDLVVREFESCIGLWADSAEPFWASLSLPLSLPLPCSLSQKINTLNNNNNKKKISGRLGGAVG